MPMELKKEDLTLAPEYSKTLYNLLLRSIKKPQYSRHIPRLLDFYIYTVLRKGKFDPVEAQGNLLLTQGELEHSLKFSRDIIQFLFGKKIPDFAKQLMTT
jgi:hypothetical protein